MTETGVTGGVSFTGDTPMLEALTRAIVPHIPVNVRYEVYCVRSTIQIYWKYTTNLDHFFQLPLESGQLQDVPKAEN